MNLIIYFKNYGNVTQFYLINNAYYLKICCNPRLQSLNILCSHATYPVDCEVYFNDEEAVSRP